MRLGILPLLLAPLAVAASAARSPAQAVAAAPTAFRSCAEEGVSRILVGLPPDRTQEQVQASLDGSGALPAGTEVYYIPWGRLPRMQNGEEMGKRIDRLLYRLLNDGYKIDGSTAVLLAMNADGTVREVTPNTGNRQLDHHLRNLWKGARFDPVVIGGCRVSGWLQVPVSFSSDYSYVDGNRMEVRTGVPPR